VVCACNGQAEAERVVGHAVNLASPSQLSAALYSDLGLPPPLDRAGR
jgi:DNA polymerase I-like protein with 3'-5' exonuclease and polymerase domains